MRPTPGERESASTGHRRPDRGPEAAAAQRTREEPQRLRHPGGRHRHRVHAPAGVDRRPGTGERLGLGPHPAVLPRGRRAAHGPRVRRAAFGGPADPPRGAALRPPDPGTTRRDGLLRQLRRLPVPGHAKQGMVSGLLNTSVQGGRRDLLGRRHGGGDTPSWACSSPSRECGPGVRDSRLSSSPRPSGRGRTRSACPSATEGEPPPVCARRLPFGCSPHPRCADRRAAAGRADDRRRPGGADRGLLNRNRGWAAVLSSARLRPRR